MLRLLSDENLLGPLVRGLMLREPSLDLVRAQDVGLTQTDDRIILEWCAREGRILLTHDYRTMARFAYERAAAGLPMPGVFMIDAGSSVGQLIDEVLLRAIYSDPFEWVDAVHYIS